MARGALSLARKYISVEPVLFAFMFSLFLTVPIEEQLIYRKICYSKYNDSFCNEVFRTKNNSLKQYEDAIQKETSKFLLYKHMTSTIPSIPSTLILGSLSDKVGRKYIMALPFIGTSLQAVGLIVNSYFMFGPPLYILIGTFLSGVFGNFATVLFSVFSYIADVTDKQTRTYRVSVLESMIFVSGALGELIGGVLVAKSGFLTAFSLCLSFYVVAILYILTYIKESYFPTHKQSLRSLVCSSEPLRQIVQVTLRRRENSYRKIILLLIAVFTAQVLVFVASSEIAILYSLRNPLKWSSDVIGYFLASGMATKGFGVLVVMPFLLKVFKLRDYSLVITGLFSTMAMYIIFGFSVYTWMMFIAPIIGMLSGIPAPCVRSLLTKMVDKSEQGSMMATVASFEVLATLVASLIFNNVYYATVEWYPGFSFFLMATLLLSPVFVIWYLQSKYGVETPYGSINAPEDAQATVESSNSEDDKSPCPPRSCEAQAQVI